ncbi:MAG: hypothetical protein Q8Q23_01060 [bacterium]|nr:hypothetical protein [bacterium]
MKVKEYFMVALVAVIFNGCGTALQTAVIVGDIAFKAKDVADALPNRKSGPDIIIGKELEVYRVREYTVKLSEGSFKNEPILYFIAYKDDSRAGSISFQKNNSDDMQMIREFNRMSEAEKKVQLRKWFLEYSIVKLDLGPIETETAQKSSTAPSTSAPNFTIPSFAPGSLPR